MYEADAPMTTDDDGDPLLHIVFGNLAQFYEDEVAGHSALEARFWATIERLASLGGRYVADDALAGSFIEHFCLGDERQKQLIEAAAELQGPTTREYIEFYWRGREPWRLARPPDKARGRDEE